MPTQPDSPSAPARSGLTEAEARRRLEALGERGELPTSRSYASIVRANTLTLFNLILGTFLVVILLAGRPADGLFAGIMVANTAIGIVQEVRAKRTLDRLALLVAPHARVVRDGEARAVGADDVVAGDLVMLQPGDQIVADGTVARSVGLMLDESPLTGESHAVGRDEGEPLLSGSFVVEGAGSYLIEAAGEASYAASLTGIAREYRHRRSPLEQQINRLLQILVAVMVVLGSGFVWVLIRHDLPFREAAATATAGIVTLVPEGLVLLTSMTFAVAAMRLARRGMLVQALNAVEVLANVDTVCLDKTGTLTDGKLVLEQVTVAPGCEQADVERRLSAYAASAATRTDTLEAIAAGLPGEAGDVEYEVPFSSRWKWSAIRVRAQHAPLVLGAPDVLAPAEAPAEADGRRRLVFGTARAPLPEPGPGVVPDSFELLGTVVLEERMRPDAAETVAFLRLQGVAVKVLSGDAAGTVAAVAERAGIPAGPGPVAGSSELPDDPAALAALAEERTVFGRLTPEDKRRLIEALAGSGRIVAMIGDGVNDVPAMKASRLAIAFGAGSQLAKSVADAVLVNDEFAVLPGAVGQGRRIIANVQRVARLFVTKSVFAAGVIATFGLATATFPLLPRHLSLAAVFTVGVPGFIFALLPGEPRPEDESFLRRVGRFSLPAGLVMAGAVVLAFLTDRELRGRSEVDARTVAVTVMVAVGLYVLLVLDRDRMRTSRPYAVTVAILVGVLALGYLFVLASPAMRDFFALSTPGFVDWLVVAAAVALAIQAFRRIGMTPVPPRPAGSGGEAT
ncbi:MAG TPA: HAD-IC family P-type ATPase [Gemmatimonadales bacterium]|nr:HAD-IC family P-type ATPase [Gemmatimonadales bacterium]